MPIDLYFKQWSPSCRIVEMVLKELKIDANIIVIDLKAGEHKKDEFLKINPQHKIPTIIDDGFILSESRAIITYLCDKYGGDNTLYPKDVHTRAQINRILFFDCGTYYPACYNYFTSLTRKNCTEEQFKIYEERLHESLHIINEFLSKEPYFVGANYTLADIGILSATAMVETLNVDFTPYPNIKAWLSRMRTNLPCYEEVNETKECLATIQDYHRSFSKPKNI